MLCIAPPFLALYRARGADVAVVGCATLGWLADCARCISCTRRLPHQIAPMLIATCRTWIVECQLPVTRSSCARPKRTTNRPHAAANATVRAGTPDRAAIATIVQSVRTSTTPIDMCTATNCSWSPIPAQMISPSARSSAPQPSRIASPTLIAVLIQITPLHRRGPAGAAPADRTDDQEPTADEEDSAQHERADCDPQQSRIRGSEIRAHADPGLPVGVHHDDGPGSVGRIPRKCLGPRAGGGRDPEVLRSGRRGG